jgi:ribonuclease HI
MNKIEEFQTKREKGNELIMSEDFLPIKRFFALDSRAYDDGEIPVKYKEMMGLVASIVMRCNDCVAYHIIQSHKSGCTRGEINEALNIGLIVGGSIIIPHLRYAYTLIDELYN